MTGKDLIYALSLDLNDQEPGFEYCRWTAFQLGTYVREGLAHMVADARLAPDGMTDEWIHTVVVKLKDTIGWQSACDCGCEIILRVNGISTSAGEITQVLPRLDDDEEMVWQSYSGPTCSPSPTTTDDDDSSSDTQDGDADSDCPFQYQGYIINEDKPCEFKIVPPQGGETTEYASVECYMAPSIDDLYDEIPDSWVGPIKQWALYRALAVDSENNSTVASVALTHRETFFKLVEDLRNVRVAHKQEILELRRFKLMVKMGLLGKKSMGLDF